MSKKTKSRGGKNGEGHDKSKVTEKSINAEDKEGMESESLRKQINKLNEQQTADGMRMLKVEIPKRIASITSYIQVG